MAKTLKQYRVSIIRAEDLRYDRDNNLYIRRIRIGSPKFKSRETFVSENRLFRMFSKTKIEKTVELVDKLGNPQLNEDGEVMTSIEYIRDAKEFVVLDMGKAAKKKKKFELVIKQLLRDGFRIYEEDKTFMEYKRVVASASQTRVKKRLFTSLDPAMVREKGSFGARFNDQEVIMKMEARYGQMTSTSHSIHPAHRTFTFDVMPDAESTVDTVIERYDNKTDELVREDKALELTPLDGQGTILPIAAVDIAFYQDMISYQDKEYMTNLLEKQPDVRQLVQRPKFAKLWAKVPSAFQVRYGFVKGLLVVFPHNLPEFAQDCNGQKERTTGLVMDFFQEDRHEYDFSKDIMFTDSMWKGNFNPYYTTKECPADERVPLEIVLYQKSKPQFKTFMGYQYWQALKPIDIRVFAKREIDRLKDTVLTDADEALAFLSLYDTGNESAEQLNHQEKMTRAGGRIQKIMEVLSENPEMIKERYIQSSIRKIFEKFIERMKEGRIPVDGANPYVASSPEVQFGQEPFLKINENYYNGMVSRFAGFRSPLIHRSEAVVLDTIDVPEYHGLFRDLLILNIFQDTLPRMGGADTDGDKIALVADKDIIDAVYTDLPMLYDAGASAEKVPVNAEEIYESDRKSILEESKSIGELTNYATSFKDLAQCKAMMEKLGLDEEQIDHKVKLLRFMQGYSIDFAKTGFFPMDSFNLHGLEMKKSPDWLPWSAKLMEFDDEAEVYKSQSQLGRLSRAIGKYLVKYKEMANFKSRDFTLEMTEGATKSDMDRVRPIVEGLEHAYRMDLASLKDRNLEEDEEAQELTYIIEKYQQAVLSIDADIATVAACAYDLAYHANGSNGKSFTFPWVICYDGLLLNIAKSNDTKTKLRKTFYEGHIDNIPQTLKFYKKQSTGEGYTVKATVPNGTYETFRKNGQLFIKMASSSIAKTVEARVQQLVPENKVMPFAVSGFKFAKKSSKQVLSLLRKNNVVTLKKVKSEDDGGLRIGVFVDDVRIGAVYAAQVSMFKDYIPCQLEVRNVDKLEHTFFSAKRNRVEDARAYNLDAVFLTEVEAEEVELTTEETYSYEDMNVDYEYGAGYYPEYEENESQVQLVEDEIDIDVDLDDEVELNENTVDNNNMYDNKQAQLNDDDIIDFGEENETVVQLVHFNSSILSKINKKADYWTQDTDVSKYKITSVRFERLRSVKVGTVVGTVTLTNSKGKKLPIDIYASAKNVFVAMTEKNIPASVEALALQVAHYELYADHLLKKQA